MTALARSEQDQIKRFLRGFNNLQIKIRSWRWFHSWFLGV